MAYDIVVGRNEADKKKFGERGLINLGKLFVKMGNVSSLSNKVLMDVARSHVVLVSGKRGSGKSYSLAVMAEELSKLDGEVAENIAVLIFDTMGIFWTMTYPNDRDSKLLSEWGMNPEGMDAKILVPVGFMKEYEKRGVPVSGGFSIKPSELSAADWCLTFGIELNEAKGVLISRVVGKLDESGEYGIADIVKAVGEDKKAEEKEKNAVENFFLGAVSWGIFSEKGTAMSEIIEGGKTSVLDLSCYNSVGAFSVRALVVSLVSRKLFMERMLERKKEEVEWLKGSSVFDSQRLPLVWLFFDEAHEFLKREGKTAATDALVQILREGRQPGVSMVLATQQPGEIHKDVMTQSDIVISHKITAKPDIEALNAIMQTYLLDEINVHLNNLPSLKGSAIILDDNSERIYPMRVRPRLSWHGGEAPSAVKDEKSSLQLSQRAEEYAYDESKRET